jgi:hypothetical protein
VILDLSTEELTNLIALINRAQISGAEAMAVAILKQKLEQALIPEKSK